jgi:hypothetical protein
MLITLRRQLSIPLENQPGRLATVAAVIANQGIDIEAISVLDTIEQAVVRLITSDPVFCKELLVQKGFYVIEAEVLSLEIPNTPGQLARVSAALAEDQINIDYAYGSSSRQGEKGRLILKVSNLEKAVLCLEQLKEQEEA